MHRPPKKQKVHETTVKSDNRDIIISDTRKLLIIQREGNFTYRCVDCCHQPSVCLPSFFAPCFMHAKNAKELEMDGGSVYHAFMCLLSSLGIGSVLSVGKSKTLYRKNNTIPGLEADDIANGICCPCCIIAQLRYELNAKQNEEKAAKDLEIEITELLSEGQKIDRV